MSYHKINKEELIKDIDRFRFLPGKKFDNGIIVIEYAGYKFKHVNRYNYSYNEKVHYWNCICPYCNQTFITTEHGLISNSTKSCGCLRIENTKKTYASGNVKFPDRSGINSSFYKHGQSKHKLYSKYSSMIQRCNDPNHYNYHNYGGRGIYVCDEWCGENGFINFLNWMIDHGYKEELSSSISLDRINNDGPYAPWNCKIAGLNGTNCNIQQGNNTSTNTIVNWNGLNYTITELSRHFGYKNPDRIFYRIGKDKGNKSLAEAVLAPSFSPGRKGSIERKQYIEEHGEFVQKPAIVPFEFIDYPEININDPKLAYYSREELAKIRGLNKHEN